MNNSPTHSELPLAAGRIHAKFGRALVAGVSVLLASGCASNYSPRADLSSVETIGVVVPEGASEPSGAEEVMQLYNLSVGEDRLKNSAIGAGSGAAVGTAAGVGIGAITGCTFSGPWAPICWTMFGLGGAVLGGTTGAVAGATVDTQEPVDAAPLHLYEVNQVLPELTQDYLASPVLQARALHMVLDQGTPVNFVPASWNGQRYAPTAVAYHEDRGTDVNLVLTEMHVSMNGKAKEDPKLIFRIDVRWSLTRYNPETQEDEVWDAMPASYESKRHRLSKWLANDGELLKEEANTGLHTVLTYAFSDLPGMATP
ncbi:MAG: hypothetical protein JSV45_10115 [Chromatiales bacterium]|nr:MAG: hypothetical protein JSV45_10115 [Chromatiales bacterium]